jgi:CDP-diacylglycerol--glycerol-3-phosphate 3-phosphatidyltransferase
MLNVPNLLTLFRILLVPLLVVALLTKFEGKEYVALGLFLLAAATDVLDGYVARRRRQVTRLGKLLDPAADKILMSAAFISLVELNVAPAWMVVLIVARELAISALRSFAAADAVVIAADLSGKVKTAVHTVAVSVCIIHERLWDLGADDPTWLVPTVLWASVAMSVVSGIDYFVRYGRLVLAPEPARPAPLSGSSSPTRDR